MRRIAIIMAGAALALALVGPAVAGATHKADHSAKSTPQSNALDPPIPPEHDRAGPRRALRGPATTGEGARRRAGASPPRRTRVWPGGRARGSAPRRSGAGGAPVLIGLQPVPPLGPGERGGILPRRFSFGRSAWRPQ